MSLIDDNAEKLDETHKLLKSLQQQRSHLNRQITEADAALRNQLDQSLEWIRNTIGPVAYPDNKDLEVFVHQRIPPGSVYEPDMLEPFIGFWLQGVENGRGILVCTSFQFIVFRNIVARTEPSSSYDADIKNHFDFLNRKVDTVGVDSAVCGTLQAIRILQKALST